MVPPQLTNAEINEDINGKGEESNNFNSDSMIEFLHLIRQLKVILAKI